MRELIQKIEELIAICKQPIDNITKFRKNCIVDYNVICTKEFLYDKWLTTKKLSEIWWKLEDAERDLIAKFIIENWLFYYIPYKRSGHLDCNGGIGDWQRAACSNNAQIRYLQFGDKQHPEIKSCYYSKDKEEEHCWFSEQSFELPIHITSVLISFEFGHSICAFQTKKDIKNFDSWRFFQYRNSDICPGNSQMPFKATIRICNTIRITPCSGSSSNTIASFQIDEEGDVTEI